MALTQVRFVSGKGGVGKTTVATAMALGCARAGRRTLLCELHGGDRVAALLGVAPVGYALREIFDDLSVVDINRADAIREYALLTLKLDALYRAAFENRLVRHFIRMVPSLGELVLLGKIWFHAQQTVRDRPRFDVIVVDAPATGHALALLRAPAAVQAIMPPGPLRDNAARLAAMLSDPAQTALHVVTTAEEMPATEAAVLAEGAAALRMRLGRPVVNRALAPLPAGAAAALATLAGRPPCAELPALLARREARRAQGEVALSALPPALRAEALALPELPASTLTLAGLAPLVRLLGALDPMAPMAPMAPTAPTPPTVAR